jgi:hypothetical protein
MRVKNHFDIRIANHLDGAPLDFAVEFDNDNDSRLDGKNSERRSQFFPYAAAVGLSLLAHVAAVTGVWFGSGFSQPAIEPRVSVGQVISIGLIKKNPYATPKMPAPEPAEKVGADERLDGVFQPSTALLSPPTPPAFTVESHALSPAALIPAPLITPELDVLVARDLDQTKKGVLVPSAAAVSMTLTTLEQERNRRGWERRCTESQKRSELIACDERAAPSLPADTFDSVSINPTYRALVELNLRGRSERSVSAIVSQSDSVGSLLQKSELPGELSGYVMEEIEAAISLNSGRGNRTLVRMQRLVDKSAAGEMAERILSDPWLQNAVRERKDRQAVR